MIRRCVATGFAKVSPLGGDGASAGLPGDGDNAGQASSLGGEKRPTGLSPLDGDSVRQLSPRVFCRALFALRAMSATASRRAASAA